jgi:hypothetical protein
VREDAQQHGDGDDDEDGLDAREISRMAAALRRPVMRDPRPGPASICRGSSDGHHAVRDVGEPGSALGGTGIEPCPSSSTPRLTRPSPPLRWIVAEAPAAVGRILKALQAAGVDGDLTASEWRPSHASRTAMSIAERRATAALAHAGLMPSRPVLHGRLGQLLTRED